MTNKKPERKLYKISHLTEMLGVTPRTVRYYDQFGLLPHVKRTSGNMRLFDEEDIELIKKIRHLQKKEFLPLDIIKERLFGDASKPSEEMTVVSDSALALPAERVKTLNVTIVPFKVRDKKDWADDQFYSGKKQARHDQPMPLLEPTQDEYEAVYRELAKKGYKTIVSFHISQAVSDSYKNAKKAANRVIDAIEVIVVDTQSMGGAHGVFVNQVAQAIYDKQPKSQVELLISKNQPLMYDLITLSNLPSALGSVETQTQAQQIIAPKALSFRPIVKLEKGEFDVMNCVQTKDEALEETLELVQREVEARGGFVRHIGVTYDYLYAEAVEFSNHLKELYPRSTVELQEATPTLTGFLGRGLMGVSLM